MEPDDLWHVHKSVPLVPTHSKINPVRTIPSCLFKIELISSSHLQQFLPSAVIPVQSNVLFTQ